MAKRGYGSSGSRSSVSAARLSQKSGVSHSFGGYTKVSHGNGKFSMQKTSQVKHK